MAKTTSIKKTVKAEKPSTTKKVVVKKVATKKVAVKKATPTKATKVAPSKTATKEPKFIAHSTSLKVGDKAPTFSAKNQHGETVSLKDFKGKNIVLYFYPKDNTPGCTMEACSLRDEHQFLSKKNFVVLGVSADDEKMHKKFATKYDLPFSLLADTDMAIIKAYDIWGTKQFMGKIYDGIIRTTIIINEKGVISHVIKDVNTKEHGKQILGL
jgi:peroxiredoxin Q/BCP